MKRNSFSNLRWLNAFVLATAMLLVSCYDDKGNYDYTVLEPMEITFPSASYIIPIGESLSIVPEVRTTPSQRIIISSGSLPKARA